MDAYERNVNNCMLAIGAIAELQLASAENDIDVSQREFKKTERYLVKIWFISDTHCEHQSLQVPEVDAVIHCGDESNHGNAWMTRRTLS